MRTHHLLTSLLASQFVFSAVGAARESPIPMNGLDSPATQPAEKRTMMTGTLAGGRMAIGGETTGWALIGDGATGGIDVDVSRVRDQANQLEGRRVIITGRMSERTYVERGKVPLLLAEKIEPAATSD